MPKSKYYKILGLPPTATLSEVRIAYRKLVMKYHPDKNTDEFAQQKFIEIKDAYEILAGKKALPTVISKGPKTAEIRKQEQEARIKEAQKRYEEQQAREFLENELYYRKLTSGYRWKIIRYSAVLGVLICVLLIADQFLPHHFTNDKVLRYTIDRALGENGNKISLVEMESGTRYWISHIRYSLVSSSPDVFVERSWVFHNPIRLVSIEKLGFSYYPIHFRFFRHTWLLIVLFLLPGLTVLIKRRTIYYSILYNFSYYGVNGIMLFYLITGDRWAHLMTFGFF